MADKDEDVKLHNFWGVPLSVVYKHYLFFMLTYASMTMTYYAFSTHLDTLTRVLDSLMYGTALIIILLGHEMGHYLNSKKYTIDVSMPYFIPFPFVSPFGTLGAFIRMRTLPPDHKALLEISFWGPAMSFLLSLPVLIVGLYLSDVQPSVYENQLILSGADYVFGGSVLITFISEFILSIPDGHAIFMHPLAFAGWVGLFVTAINLFPIGQLDGGHIAYVFLRTRQKYIAYIFMFVLLILGVKVSSGWLFWVFFLLFMGIRHPIMKLTYSDEMYESKSYHERRRIAFFSVVIFVLSFIPEPIKVAKSPVKTVQDNGVLLEKKASGKIEQPNALIKKDENFNNIQYIVTQIMNTGKDKIILESPINRFYAKSSLEITEFVIVLEKKVIEKKSGIDILLADAKSSGLLKM